MIKKFTIAFYSNLAYAKCLIKLFDPYISSEETNAAAKVIKSKFWASGSGINNVKKFEDIDSRPVTEDEVKLGKKSIDTYRRIKKKPFEGEKT